MPVGSNCARRWRPGAGARGVGLRKLLRDRHASPAPAAGSATPLRRSGSPAPLRRPARRSRSGSQLGGPAPAAGLAVPFNQPAQRPITVSGGGACQAMEAGGGVGEGLDVMGPRLGGWVHDLTHCLLL
eukprot:jgi/Ulvmu1/11127/UM071_0010.1